MRIHKPNYMPIASIAATIIGILLFPKDVFAWGPVAHLDFASQFVTGAAALTPTLMKLIQKYPFDFYYGTHAADMIIGKNRAKQHDHCHSWSQAGSLWKKSLNSTDEQLAFMLGYIGHLGADVVAHNYIVPQMLIVHYKRKGVGHLYWEARADQRILAINPSLKDLWKELSQIRFPSHDAFLSKNLVPALVPNKLSARLYSHSLAVQRASTWRHAMEQIDKRSRLLFDQNDLLNWRNLAINLAGKAMKNPTSATLNELDPTGKKALKSATLYRKALRRKNSSDKDKQALQKMYDRALRKVTTVHIGAFEQD